MLFFSHCGTIKAAKDNPFIESEIGIGFGLGADVTHGNQLTILFVYINEDSEVVISAPASAHLGAGGRASIGFNITEFIRRLFD